MVQILPDQEFPQMARSDKGENWMFAANKEKGGEKCIGDTQDCQGCFIRNWYVLILP